MEERTGQVCSVECIAIPVETPYLSWFPRLGLSMRLSSRSPWKVILVALVVVRQRLSGDAHRFSADDFTHALLFACLDCMAFVRTDYRGLDGQLREAPEPSR